MAKIDKSQYTKEEWRKIKEQRRLAKTGTKQKTSFDPKADYTKNFILCLKWGKKYSATYVNKLYNMCKRNCTLDYTFVCMTDDPLDLDPNIKIIDLPKNSDLKGWWYKPYMYSADLPIKGTILYMDLDVVISGNIDKLFTYQPMHWCTIRDFTRAMRPKWHKYNSSIVKFRTGELDFLWNDYIKDPVSIQRRYFGDQDYLYEATLNKRPMLYPDSWVQSWKWEVRKDKTFVPGGTKGNRVLKTIENVVPRIECCVCVFHGDPNPENCLDPWVVDNWK